MKKKKKKPARRVRYWHGLGACRDPLTVRRVETAEMLGVPVRPNAPLDSREYVYASTSREVALAFSILAGGHAVCEIGPAGLVAETDPDFPTLGVRFHGPVKAVTVELVSDSARPNARQITQTLAPDGLWLDGEPRYFDDGYLRAPPLSRERGYSDEDFRWLGRWWPWHFLIPNDDWTEVAFDDLGRPHAMYPPDHPDLHHRRRLPRGVLHSAWTRPGFYPDLAEFRLLRRQRIAMGDSTLRVLRPWDW